MNTDQMCSFAIVDQFCFSFSENDDKSGVKGDLSDLSDVDLECSDESIGGSGLPQTRMKRTANGSCKLVSSIPNANALGTNGSNVNVNVGQHGINSLIPPDMSPLLDVSWKNGLFWVFFYKYLLVWDRLFWNTNFVRRRMDIFRRKGFV